MQTNPLGKAIDIKISTIVAISAILHHTDPLQLDRAMRDMTGGESDFFEDELAVLDIGNIDAVNQSIDWPALIALFRCYRLHVVAVRNAPIELEADLLAHGLTLDRNSKSQREVMHVAAPAAVPATAPAAAPADNSAPLFNSTMIIDTPVRAGQRIYARGCDLIITAAVNNGAEVIADGSIHIYAPLRGRALAGASGNVEARIFTALMEAELVSIAGIYRTFDAGYPEGLAQRSVQIRLVGDRLDVHCVNS